MPKVPCPAGRTYIRGNKTVQVWHNPDGSKSSYSKDSDGKCPICYKAPSEPLPATEPVSPESLPTEEKKPERPPAPAAKPGIMTRLGFGTRTTKPEVAAAPPKNPEPSYFVDANHVQKFANLIYAGGRWVFNLYDKFAMTEEAGMRKFTDKHPELLSLSDFEKEAIKLDPATDMWGRFATGFTRLVGCKTQEQAHSAIATLDLIGHFGALIGFGAEHIWESWKKGKPFREAARKAKKEAAKFARGVKASERAESQGEGGAVPSVRPGAVAGT